LKGIKITITDNNPRERARLREELVSAKIAMKISKFRPSMGLKETKADSADADANTGGRIVALEEKANQHSHVGAIWQCRHVAGQSNSALHTF
jgi:hypothetical protein